MLKQLIGLATPKDPVAVRAEAFREAIHEEAKVGGAVFGEVPAGVRREFFCLDERTWVWHEEWSDDDGKKQVRTTRYDVRPHGIFKSQNGQQFLPVSRDEVRNLIAATKRYNEIIDTELAPVFSAQR